MGTYLNTLLDIMPIQLRCLQHIFFGIRQFVILRSFSLVIPRLYCLSDATEEKRSGREDTEFALIRLPVSGNHMKLPRLGQHTRIR